MEKKDERLKIVGEILRGIKVSVFIRHFENWGLSLRGDVINT